jgi:hypothetical protein
MIYATIIVCKLTMGLPDCILLSDNRGPYNAIEHCIKRTEEMQRDALRVLPKYEVTETNCISENKIRRK